MKMVLLKANTPFGFLSINEVDMEALRTPEVEATLVPYNVSP
jgi:hypothetical protein